MPRLGSSRIWPSGYLAPSSNRPLVLRLPDAMKVLPPEEGFPVVALFLEVVHRFPIGFSQGGIVSMDAEEDVQDQSEINFLGRLSHPPNLVKLLGHCSENNEYLLVYEFMAKWSLESHVFRRGCVSLSWELRLKIVIGAARGLAFLHQSDLIYRDFKASNILLDENYTAKLSDFGLVKVGPNGAFKSHISTRVMGVHMDM